MRVLILVCLAVLATLASLQIQNNTLQDKSLSDASRYYYSIKEMKEERVGLYIFYPLVLLGEDAFQLTATFLFILAVSSIFYLHTGSWFKTAFATIGIFVSMTTYFFLLAQMCVAIIMLWLWFRADPKKDLPIFIGGTLLAHLFHQFGAGLILAVFTTKYFSPRLQHLAKPAFVIAGAIAIVALFFASNSAERVAFFFHFLLPFSMGWIDYLFWFLWIAVLVFQAYKHQPAQYCLLTSVIFVFSAVAFATSSHPIDFWRVLFLIEPISIAAISGKSQIEWGMFLLSIQRLVVGGLI